MSEPKIEFVEFKEKSLKGYTLIEGFPGMGLVGTIAGKYLVDKLKFTQQGYIDSSSFMPVIRIHKGVPIRPARIYVLDSKKLAIVISEQVIPKQHIYSFAKKVVEWVQKKGFSRMISLSGLHSYDENQTIVYGIAANDNSVDTLKKHGLEVIEEGITTGITALILLELKKTNIEAFSLLGNVRTAADYQAAAEILKKLSMVIDTPLDVEPLLKEAQQIEKDIMTQMKKVKETKDSVERFEPTSMLT